MWGTYEPSAYILPWNAVTPSWFLNVACLASFRSLGALRWSCVPWCRICPSEPLFQHLRPEAHFGPPKLGNCVAKTSQQRKPNGANHICNFLTSRNPKKEITLGPWAIHSVSAHLRIIGGPSSWLGGVPNWHEFSISSFAVIELKLNPQIHYHLHKCTEVHFKFSSLIFTEYS